MATGHDRYRGYSVKMTDINIPMGLRNAGHADDGKKLRVKIPNAGFDPATIKLWLCSQCKVLPKMLRAVPAKTEPDNEFMSELAPRPTPPIAGCQC